MNVKEKNGKKLLGLSSLECLTEAAERLKCVAHPQRLRIIELLLNGEFTVGEISEICQLEQSVTSIHLRLLHSKKFLKSHRSNRYVYYSLLEKRVDLLIELVKSLGSKESREICDKCGE